MAQNVIAVDRDQVFLLPPSLHDWVARERSVPVATTRAQRRRSPSVETIAPAAQPHEEFQLAVLTSLLQWRSASTHSGDRLV
jgi:hypothetical protein